MKTGLTSFICALLSSAGLVGLPAGLYAQTTYYVASSGNDGNTGRSTDAPFQSLNKVNSLNLQPGDQVLFRRGDTFRGTLQIRRSGTSGQPIVFDAFGSGNKPVLAGSVPISNWNSIGGNVWQADAPALGSQVTGVYRNGAAQPLGRYPNLNSANRGYLTIQSHSGNSQITSAESVPINFVGGEFVMRPVQWVMNRHRITQQNGNTITFNNFDNYGPADTFGFFIQDHPATLDQQDEWYYNPSNKTLRIYDTGNPNGQLITATTNSAAVDLTGISNVTVRNVAITQTQNMGVLVENASAITLSGLDVTNSGEDGLLARGVGNTLTIENSLIEAANNNGVTISGYQNTAIRGNTIRSIGISPGRGKNGEGSYIGITIVGSSNTTIENNVLDQIGYNGINFVDNTLVQRNRVSNFCQTKTDGGGLYIWNGNQQPMNNVRILSNIVYNGIGAPEGNPILYGGYSGANGIFLDDCTANAVVSDNTVFNNRGLGIFLHGPTNARVTNNTSFNNGEAQLALNSRTGGCSPRDNNLQNNVLVSKTGDQLVTKYETHLNDLASFGAFDNNVYARPFDENAKMRVVYNPGSGAVGTDMSLSEWQSLNGKDPNSRNSPITYKPFLITGNGNFKLNQPFNGNNEGWDAWSPYGNGRAAWDNPGRLDGGSLSIAFPSASGQGNSYVLASKDIGSVNQNQVYLLTFDAVASGPNKRIEVFIRQKTGSYNDLDARAEILVGTGRQRFELSYRANASEGSAIVVFQVNEDGKTLWIDNVQLQEASRTAQNPDDLIRFEYNDTGQDKTVSLGGNYRDARNTLYTQITLAPFTSVVLFKEAGTTPPPPPTTTLRDPENPANAVAGLDFRYYQGSWSQLPNFDALTPVRTGTTDRPKLSVAYSDDDDDDEEQDNFGLQFRGYVNVPSDGQYTFYTNSDDGSKLFIGTTEVVNNDGGHGEQERSGTIGLKAGRHAITIPYFEGGGGQALSVSYSGPGVSKQIIPASAFFRTGTGTPPPPPPTASLRDPENPANAVSGLDYSYYEGNWDALPNFGALTPVKTGTASQADLSPRNRDDNFGLQFRGYVNVPTDGQYTFYTNSDDGSKLFIGTTQVVDNDGGHAEQERSGTIGLKAGRHAITIPYYEGGGGQALSVSYSGPGVSKQTIPASALFRVGTGTPPPPPPTSTLRDPENPANAVSGLDYGYYEGSWSVLPDFNALTPVKTGTNGLPDISVRSRSDNYGLRYTGYVNVPADGQYSFFTNSDDGSKLYIGNTQIVDNDGSHGEQERTGTIGLKTGRHAITIVYYQGGGGQALSVSYSGPGVSKQTIPASAFFRTGTGTGTPPPTSTGTGLLGNYFNNRTLAAPSVFSRTDAVVDFDWNTGSPGGGVAADNFSVRWTGQVEAPATGDYVFTTTADDGIRLWVNDVQVIDDWRDHSPTTINSNAVALVAGRKYNIRVEYYENAVGAIAQLLWAYPGQGRQVIPQIRLYPASGSARLASSEERTIQQSVVFPVPAREELTVRYFSEQAGTANMQMISAAGVSLLQTDRSVTVGENLLKLSVRDLTRGVYILKLTQNGQQRTWKVILSE